MSPALKNDKNFAKNEEKPCPEIFTSQKLKISAKLVKDNAILTDFLVGLFSRLSREITKNLSFLAVNQNAIKCNTYP